MPTVRAYPAGQAPTPAPVTSARFITPQGGDIGPALKATAQDLAAVAQEEARQRDVEDEAAAKQLAIQRTAFTTSLLYGDGTPEHPGYYNLRGKAALDAEPEVRRQLEENASALSGQASDGQQQRIFSQFLDNDTVSEERRMAGHRGNQLTVYQLEMTVGRAATYVNRAAVQGAAGDAAGQRTSIEAGWLEYRDGLRITGMDGDGEYIAGKRLEYLSGIHQKTIAAMVSQGNDVAAEAYFRANSGEMTVEAQGAVAGPLRAQAEVTRGVSRGRAAWLQFPDDPAAGYAALETDNPRETAAARAEYDRKRSERAAIKDEAHDSALLAATNSVFADGTNPALMDLSRFSLAERTALEKAYADRANGPPVQDGSDEYYRLRQVAVDHPDDFARALTGSNITSVRVSRSDMEKLWTLKEAIVKGERTTAATRTVDTSFKAAMTRAEPILASYGIRNDQRTGGAYGAFQVNVLRHLDFLERTGNLDAKSIDEAINFAFLATSNIRRGNAGRGTHGAGVPEGAALPRPGTNYLPLDQVEKSIRAANPQANDATVRSNLDYYVATGGRAVYRYDNIPANIRTQLADRIKAATGKPASQFAVEEAFTRYVMTRGQ